jgi:hypothetical protein
MEGSVLSFLKAEWKVSDTGSTHWASSFVLQDIYELNPGNPQKNTLNTGKNGHQKKKKKFLFSNISWEIVEIMITIMFHVYTIISCVSFQILIWAGRNTAFQGKTTFNKLAKF